MNVAVMCIYMSHVFARIISIDKKLTVEVIYNISFTCNFETCKLNIFY